MGENPEIQAKFKKSDILGLIQKYAELKKV